MKHLFHSFGGIVLVTAFLHSGAGQSNAQENDTAGAVPLVSPSALESVASPAKVRGWRDDIGRDFYKFFR